MMGRKMLARLALTVTPFLAVAAWTGPARADSSAVDVLLPAIGGSRVLGVTTISGTDLNGKVLDLGHGATGGFAVDVADVSYQHVGYQVSSDLSNLYLWNNGSFDCSTKIPAGALSVAFPVDPTVADLGEVVNGVIDLTGTVTNGLADTIDPSGTIRALLSGVGAPSLEGQPIDVTGLVAQTTDTLNGLLGGLSSQLPVQIHAGSAGSYANAASHPQCGEGSGTPTSRMLMSGDASSLGDFAGSLISTLTGLVNGVTGNDLINNGVIDAADAQAKAAAALQQLHDSLEAAAGIPLPPFVVDINAILDALTGTLSGADLLGQTGTYLTIPALAANTNSAPASGVYRGTMTVTLVDTPS